MEKFVVLLGVIVVFCSAVNAVLFTGGPVTVANTSLTYCLKDGVPANTTTLGKFTRLNLEAPSTNSGTLYYGTSSTANTDSDGNLCVYDGGTGNNQTTPLKLAKFG